MSREGVRHVRRKPRSRKAAQQGNGAGGVQHAAEVSAVAPRLGVRETARIVALVAKVGDAIGRLTELRTALISAAVTGKIDVRDTA